MSEFDSGNSVNCVLFYINLYETKRENNWSPIPNTGLMSVPFPPLLTGLWVGIMVLFKWAAIGETPGQFFMGGGSKLCYKIFYIP